MSTDDPASVDVVVMPRSFSPPAYGEIAVMVRVPPEDRANPANDIAECYAVEVSDELPGGCIIWGLYQGKWTANVSGSWLISQFIRGALRNQNLTER